MILDWLRTEAGGIVVGVSGYILREFTENQHTPEKILEKRGIRFMIRITSAAIAATLVLLLLPADAPAYIRVGSLVLAGVATPELVNLLLTIGLARLGDYIRGLGNNGR